MKLIGKFIGVCAALASCSAVATTLLSEGFENIATLPANGWVQTNNSSGAHTTSWFQDIQTPPFSAAAGSPTSFIAANLNNAGYGGTISNWLITPEVALSNGETFNFSLRLLGEGSVDTVQIYMSTSGASSNVGATTSSTGDFLVLLGSFSSMTDTGWMDQSLMVSGLAGMGSGRFAFRYLVGDTSVDGDYIGIDSVSMEAPRANAPGVPEPATLALFGAALGALGLARRQARRRPASAPGHAHCNAVNTQQ